jgi:hypothetical protein
MTFRTHHTASRSAAPIERNTPTPEAAVLRTVSWLVASVRAPSGESSATVRENTPAVLATTGTRSVVFWALRSMVQIAEVADSTQPPPGNPTGRKPNFWLVIRTRTRSGYGALLKIVIGISP